VLLKMASDHLVYTLVKKASRFITAGRKVW
jgi:hypothetical protein